jgi:hypothetical protein
VEVFAEALEFPVRATSSFCDVGQLVRTEDEQRDHGDDREVNETQSG